MSASSRSVTAHRWCSPSDSGWSSLPRRGPSRDQERGSCPSAELAPSQSGSASGRDEAVRPPFSAATKTSLLERLSDARGSGCGWPVVCRSPERSPARRAPATPRTADDRHRQHWDLVDLQLVQHAGSSACCAVCAPYTATL